jgi:DNA-binding NtrC family response regulator
MHEKIKILLFDLDPENTSGANLRKLLEVNTKLLEIRYRSISAIELAQSPRFLASIITRFVPELTCLVFGATRPELTAEIFAVLRAAKVAQPVIAIVSTGEKKDVSAVLYNGANDFLIPPFRATDVVPRILRWVDEARQEDRSIQTLKEKLGLRNFIGESHSLMAEIQKIPAAARCATNVLISGETGTGKEVCARAIHYLSPRLEQPFVAVNCGAIPSGLVENELFGHVAGAFTGAAFSALGLIREADGGTLFLDEIDALPLQAQVKLLRFLQEKEIRPLGSRKTSKADVRVVAAANCDLQDAMRAGRFRQDLYYRLNVVTITMPPLRLRPGDVPLLARYFVAKFTTEIGKESKAVTPAALQKLVLYEWPGNVRELENVIQRSVVMSQNAMIDGHEIVLPQSAVSTGVESFQALKAIAIADFEQQFIKKLLLSTSGNISKASHVSGLDRRGLQRLIQKGKLDARGSIE